MRSYLVIVVSLCLARSRSKLSASQSSLTCSQDEVAALKRDHTYVCHDLSVSCVVALHLCHRPSAPKCHLVCVLRSAEIKRIQKEELEKQQKFQSTCDAAVDEAQKARSRTQDELSALQEELDDVRQELEAQVSRSEASPFVRELSRMFSSLVNAFLSFQSLLNIHVHSQTFHAFF